MAEEGSPLHEAAKKADITRDAAVKAFKRPFVRMLHNQMVEELKDNAAQKAYLRINDLSVNAESERVRLDANRWVAGVDGISPVRRVDGFHRLYHTFGGFEYPTLDAKDVTPDDFDDYIED